MKTYDMIQTLLEIKNGLDSSLAWLQEGMGRNCGFLLTQQQMLATLINELQQDQGRYMQERVKLVDAAKAGFDLAEHHQQQLEQQQQQDQN